MKLRFFFFISLLLVAICSFLIVQKTSFVKKNQSETLIKTACRELSRASSLKPTESRVEKLNRLMDEPIDWFFTDLKGEVIDLYCLRDKQIVILNFWATWCAPCIQELPSLARLAKSHKDSLFVVALSTEDKETIKNFLSRSFKDLGSELKIVSIPEEEKFKYFPQDSLPATYIFNKAGQLKIKEIGDRDWSNPRIVQQILNLN